MSTLASTIKVSTGRSTLAKTQQFARIYLRMGSSPGFPRMPSGSYDAHAAALAAKWLPNSGW